MFKKITLALAFCSLVGVGALPVLTGTAHAASTEERFQQSKSAAARSYSLSWI